MTLILLSSLILAAADYHVGPGQPLATIGAVPWDSLEPGDTVFIHWRPEPYREKWVICLQGTVDSPISLIGVPNDEGELPIIDGADAVTPRNLNYASEERGIIKIGSANRPADRMPRHIVVENLDLRGARNTHGFTGDDGTARRYLTNASTIYLEKGENITIRNCRMHDSGNGLFVASGDAAPSRDILIEGNYIFDNGNRGSAFEHNSYTAAIGITFQNNRYGPLAAGANGNALKDRSAGLTVRYNWIEGGNRQLDLVDGEDTSLIRNHPSYAATFVYGNALIENEGDGNRQIVHYGGDSATESAYRPGTLYFHYNTVVSRRTDRTTLFRLSTNNQHCDARNNIFHAAAAGNTVSLLDVSGTLDFANNWIKPGAVVSFGQFGGLVRRGAPAIEALEPGFLDESDADYRITGESSAVDKAMDLDPAVPPEHAPAMEYRKHQSGEPRPRNGVADLGAYEARAAEAVNPRGRR